jgi:trehalose/maltose hydrolase-like predicted phosphorylase
MSPSHVGAVRLIWVALLTSLSSFLLGTASPFDNNGLSSSENEARHSETDTYQTRFPGVTWNNDLWRITTTNLDQGHYQSRMSLSNGYIGINVASFGPFFDVDLPVDGDNINNWPTYDRRQTFATIASFWDSDSTGVSLVSGIPHWAGIYMTVNGHKLTSTTPISEISNFSSQLDMKRGLMNWRFNWTPTQSSVSYAITYEMLVHRLHINQALVKMTVTSSETSTVDFINAIQGDCAVRSTFVESGTDGNLLYTAVQPIGVSNVTAYTYSSLIGSPGLASSPVVVGPSELIGFNASSIGQSYKQQLAAGKTFTLIKYVGIASSDAFEDPKLTAKHAVVEAAHNGYTASRASHIAEWAVVLPAGSVDDFTDPATGALPDDAYIQEQAILGVASPFYLLQNLPSENALAAIPNASINDHSIAVGGLGSATYAGMIFWDADIWMHPGLAASFPNAARGIANYRANKLDQARLNIAFVASSTQNNKTFSENSAVYPWVSGRYGNCTAYGACFDYEYHLNGDIALMLSNQYVITGDEATFKARDFPVIDALANFFGDVLTKNGSSYELTYMTDPVCTPPFPEICR